MSEYHKIETVFVRDPQTFKITDTLRSPVYDLLKYWEWTEKIDGTNIRCIWRDGKLSFGGKTDNAQIHVDLIKWLYENISVEKLREIFPDVSAIIYGEGYGAGIQKGGSYSPVKKLIVFDVMVADKWWLNWENVCDVANKLSLDTVPFLGRMPLEEAAQIIRTGFKSALGDCQAEGMVGRPPETLYDKKGGRLIVKLKTRDFSREK